MDYNPNKVRQTIGRYHLTGRLGKGSMGLVYRAKDSRTGRLVAVKVLQALFDSHIVERFKREVEIMSTLNHPNIVRALSQTVKRCGEHFYYFPMEFVEGQSLEQLLRKKGTLSLSETVRISLSVCRALDYAHSKGVIHRDLKPGNILISGFSGYGLVKVSDFGLAKAAFGTIDAETFSIVGSRPYCSPMKWDDSSKATPATDLFSLGVIMYRMLTGQLPFYAESEGRLRDQIVRRSYVPLSRLRQDIPQRIDQLVTHLLLSDKNVWEGAKKVADIIDKVYPTVPAGLNVFSKWRTLVKRVKRLGRNPDFWIVRREVYKYCRDLTCPDCESPLVLRTYTHVDGRIVSLDFDCGCCEHELPLDE